MGESPVEKVELGAVYCLLATAATASLSVALCSDDLSGVKK